MVNVDGDIIDLSACGGGDGDGLFIIFVDTRSYAIAVRKTTDAAEWPRRLAVVMLTIYACIVYYSIRKRSVFVYHR